MKISVLAGFSALLSCSASFAAEPPVYWDVDANGCKFASTVPVDTTQPTFVFTGKCVDGFVSGPGEVMLLDGTRTLWSGDFQQGRLLKGVAETNSGTYEGEFRDNTAHGRGTNTFSDGTIFKGRFENGMAAGTTGEVTWPDAGRYSGGLDVRTLSPRGKGIMYYTNGAILVGEFKDGGAQGTLKLPDGTVAQGTFLAGGFVRGKVTAADGRSFEVDKQTGAFFEVLKDGSKQPLAALPDDFPL
jgi:hypothetical protein